MSNLRALDSTFEQGFFQMCYPSSWKKEFQEGENSWQVSLQGPGTAMILVAADLDASVDEMLEATLHALKEDYPEMEVEGFSGDLCGISGRGFEIRFFSLDLSNVCRLLAVPSEEGTILGLFQCDDYSISEVEPVFEAIRQSMQILGA